VLHSAQCFFSLPCGQELHDAHLPFSFPWGQGLQSAHLLFSLPRGRAAVRAVSFQLPVRTGFAQRTVVFHPSVRTRVTLPAHVFHPSMRAPLRSHYSWSVVARHDVCATQVVALRRAFPEKKKRRVRVISRSSRLLDLLQTANIFRQWHFVASASCYVPHKGAFFDQTSTRFHTSSRPRSGPSRTTRPPRHAVRPDHRAARVGRG
jgi:hypothetical protein